MPATPAISSAAARNRGPSQAIMPGVYHVSRLVPCSRPRCRNPCSPERGQPRFHAAIQLVLNRSRSPLAGTDANRVLDVRDQHLAIADLAAACRIDDGVGDRHRVRVPDHDLELQLGMKVDAVAGALVVADELGLVPGATDLG